MTTQATPRPWKCFKDNTVKYKAYLGIETGSDFHGTEYTVLARFSKEEDALLARKAVNCHDELVKALNKVKEELEFINAPSKDGWDDLLITVNQALSKAQGGDL